MSVWDSIKISRPYSFLRRRYYRLKNWKTTKNELQIRIRLRRFKNYGKNRVCVIVGNGPSLRIEDLTKLHELNIDTFACNRIHKVFDQTTWRPSFYFMSDNKLVESDHGAPEEGFDNIPCFYPDRHKDNINNKKSYYYLELPFDYTKEGKFSLDASKGVYPAGSVTTEMIQFAYYMGYSEVYLIGVDFNYNITNAGSDNTYSYQGEKNYFIKGYLKPGEVADIPNLAANLMSFSAAREAFEEHGRGIFNATRGGKLEVFERADLDRKFIEWEKNTKNRLIRK